MMYNFKKASEKYLPKKIKILFIAESPPRDYRNFFYYIGEEKGNYCFFQNLILATLDIKYNRKIHNKKQLLNSFSDHGFYLIDAVEYPINSLNDSERKNILVKNKESLRERLIVFNKSGLIDSKTKIIIIKKLVCEIFKGLIEESQEIGFDKTFGVKCVGYPICYSYPIFLKQIKEIIL